MQVRADFHTHSIGEGVFGPLTERLVAEHLEAALEAGLSVLGVTDHNDLRPGLLAQEYAARHGFDADLLVLPGMEITTEERVHLVAVGLQVPIETWGPLDPTIARITQVGGLSILPHPFFAHLRLKTDVDAIERFNARYGDFNLNGTPVARVADSDAHSADDLRRSPHYTLLEIGARTWADVAAAVRMGRTTPV
jgi:predicted metal-dependent phosphoesterase TrpH